MKKNRTKQLRTLSIVLLLLFVLTGCTRIGQDLDPSSLGYEIEVTYNALGGVINQREKRLTNYAKNSLIFEPKGSSNLLIAPARTGYTLAGWYTDVKEIPGKNGEEPTYEFDPQDRWDFNVDRVHENITLYARWVNQAKAQYIDADTKEVVFTKDLTSSSPLAPLSNATLNIVGRSDATLLGYFQENLKDEIKFDEYEFSPLLPTNQQLYNQLAEEFPDNIIPYEDPELDQEEEVKIDTAAAVEAGDEDGANLEDSQILEEDTTWKFLNKFGYDMLADEDQLAKINKRKNEIIDQFITKYEENNQHNDIYLVYENGINISVQENSDLNEGGIYTFKDVGSEGSYLFESDLNLGDAAFKGNEDFSGVIDGQNHTLSNVHLKLSFSKKDSIQGAYGALFSSMTNAIVKDITFKDMTLEISAPPGVDVTAAVFALAADNCTFENVSIDGLNIISGSGDNGRADYSISEFILDDTGSTTNNVTVTNVTYDVSEFAEIIPAF